MLVSEVLERLFNLESKSIDSQLSLSFWLRFKEMLCSKKLVLFQIQYFISAIHYVTLRHKFVDVDKVEPADRVDEGEDDEEVEHAPSE